MTCPKHGPQTPCAGGRITTASVLGDRYCDPSIPHCPSCGRTLRDDG